jgi:DNA-binding beta-propeller fold protein YncE
MSVRPQTNLLPGKIVNGLFRRAVVAICVLILSGCSPGAQADPLKPPLTDAGNIQLPKEASRPAFDLLTLDPRNGRLYVSHSSVKTLEVIDARARKLIGRVPGVGSIKAIALTKDPNIVYTSDAAGTVGVVDVQGLKLKQKLDLGGSPDAIDYDPIHDIVMVGLVSDKKVAFIDATAMKLLGTMALPGSPELMTVDQKSGLAYLAIHDLNEVVEVDSSTRSIVKTLKGCDIKAPTGLAYDPDQGLLFVANSANLSIIDVVIEQCRGGIDIGHGTDQIAFNQHLHHVYTADGGSRYVSVIDTVSLKPLGVFGTGPEAATVATDPTTDMVYVMVARAGIVATYHDP